MDKKETQTKSEDIKFVSQVLIGNYPKYEQLIPEEYTNLISFSAPLLEQRMRLIDSLGIHGGITKYIFSINEDSKEHLCTIQTKGEDGNVFEYALNLPIKILEGEGVHIAFNCNYVKDAIKPFSKCELSISTPSSPGKFTGDIEGVTIVVMPMFIQW